MCGTQTIFIALLSLTGSPESLEEKEGKRPVEYHEEN